jgi:hypothetical protein
MLGKCFAVNTQCPENKASITKTLLIPDAYNGVELWITLKHQTQGIHLFLITILDFYTSNGLLTQQAM